MTIRRRSFMAGSVLALIGLGVRGAGEEPPSLPAAAPEAPAIDVDLMDQAISNEASSGRWSSEIATLRWHSGAFAALVALEYDRLLVEASA